tara:strand:- start:1604 stop:1861 length:258 start_codon:yes stop_codon:yes gene_type:complete
MKESRTIEEARSHLAWKTGSPKDFEFFGCKNDSELLNEIEKIARGEGCHYFPVKIIKPADIHTKHPASSLDLADLLSVLEIMLYA